MALDPVLATQQIVSTVRLPSAMAPGIFIPHRRSIGGIVAHVTIEETERDEVQVTQHPVEQGAPINDHAFKMPEEVAIRAGWNMQDGDLSAESGIYGMLLNWQASFIMFELVTGKRVHHNMLIQSMAVVTNSQTEYALLVDMNCREIILTKTQVTQSSAVDRGPQNMAETTSDQVKNAVKSVTTDALAAEAGM